jgi:hypothetical protein
MVPLVSDAVAVMVTLEPAVKLLPLVGLVKATTGNDGRTGTAATVTTTGVEVTETPFESVATAVTV